MARAALCWSVRDLAANAGVGLNTVTRFENGNDTLASTIRKMRDVLEGAGIVFVEANGLGPGVRLRQPSD